VAIPLAWLTMHTWLQDFSYRVNVEWYIFMVGVLLVLLLTVVTVGYETVRAATANPVKSLRYE
ncbi:MAG: hypothetical protein H7Z75_11070, partial [Ferruginibacter sp.]|nr:hypothetical protein [Cytophagales bacterium]